MFWSVLFWAVVLGSVQGRVLDLTRNDSGTGGAGTSAVREQVDCRAGRGTGRIDPPPTLSLTIAALDSSEYSMGGKFVMDVRVENIGKERLVLPSVLSHEYGGGFGLPPHALEATLVIGGIDAQSREHTLSGTVLRGSPGRIGTTESLAPGESLTIRFPGWIANVDGPSAPVTGDAKLFASLILSDNECKTWQPVNSPRVNVKLKGRG